MKKINNVTKTGLLFVMPAVILVIALIMYPVLSSIIFSFTNKHLIRPTYEFIGFSNYKEILTNLEFYTAFLTSIKWTVLSMIAQVFVGLVLAMSLNRVTKFRGIFRTILIIPWAFPSIVIAFSWKWILNDIYGFLPNILMSLNITDTPINFLANPDIVFWTVLFINTWFGAPLMMVNILSALQTIPSDQYEAAQIDGASSWQSFYHITLKHIRFVIGLLVVLRTIWVFNNFELIYLITGGGPTNITTTLPIFAYNTGWGMKQIGMASAVSVILLLFLLTICFFYFKVLNKWEKEDHS